MSDAFDRMRDAIQDWVREQDGADQLVLLDFIVSTASVDMHTAGRKAEHWVSGEGARHSLIGLARLAEVEAEADLLDEAEEDG